MAARNVEVHFAIPWVGLGVEAKRAHVPLQKAPRRRAHVVRWYTRRYECLS